MKTYQKFDAIQGLIIGFKEQLYRIEQSREGKVDEATLDLLQTGYLKAITEVINNED